MTIPNGNLVNSLNHAGAVFDEFVHKASYTDAHLSTNWRPTLKPRYPSNTVLAVIFFHFFTEQSGVIPLVYYNMYNAYTETFVFYTLNVNVGWNYGMDVGLMETAERRNKNEKIIRKISSFCRDAHIMLRQ